MTKVTAKVEKETTSLAVLATKGQEGIPGMLDIIKNQLSLLKKGSSTASTTKGKDLPGFSELKDITKVSDLIKAHSSVVGKAAAYAKSAAAMKMNTTKYPFKLEGCTEGEWVNAIISRASTLANEVEIKKLEETKKILEANLSADAKLKNDLAKIATMYTDTSALE